MVRSLEVHKTKRAEFPFDLLLREFDGVDVYHTRIMQVTAAQAAAITGPHTGIEIRNDNLQRDFRGLCLELGIEPQPIEVVKVQGRRPGCRAWRARIGGVDATFLSDDAVHILMGCVPRGGLAFEPGQPDWALRDIENIEDAIADRTEELQRLQARRDEMKLAWQAGRGAAQEAEGPEVERLGGFGPDA